jgi:hypothetical protein
MRQVARLRPTMGSFLSRSIQSTKYAPSWRGGIQCIQSGYFDLTRVFPTKGYFDLGRIGPGA